MDDIMELVDQADTTKVRQLIDDIVGSRIVWLLGPQAYHLTDAVLSRTIKEWQSLKKIENYDDYLNLWIQLGDMRPTWNAQPEVVAFHLSLFCALRTYEEQIGMSASDFPHTFQFPKPKACAEEQAQQQDNIK